MLAVFINALAFTAPVRALFQHVATSTKVAHGKAATFALPEPLVATSALLEHIAVSTKVAHGKAFALPEPIVATGALLEHIAVSIKAAHGKAVTFALPEPLVATSALLEHIAVSTKVAHGKAFALPELIVAWRTLIEHIAVSTKVAHRAPAIVAPAIVAPVEEAWRVDAPSLEEIQDACVIVSEQLAVCATPNPADDTCSIDDDLTDLYGEPVYLCRA